MEPEVAQRDEPQLTLRAFVTGSVLGFFLAIANLYVGLKTGLHFGVALTASILAFALSNLLLRLGLFRTPLSMLEINCLQSTASSAGYATGNTMISAIPALLLLSVTASEPGGRHLPFWITAAWVLAVAVLGCMLAVPMKRGLIDREQLRFPSGTAAALTLKALYAEGADAARKARALLGAALGGALFPLLIELHVQPAGEKSRGLIPGSSKLLDWLPSSAGHAPSAWLITFDHNPVMMAAGMLVGLRVAGWMLVAALCLIYGLGPFGISELWQNPIGKLVGAVTAPGSAWKEIGIWFGVPIMVAYGLGALLLDGGRLVRALRGLGGGGEQPVEVPARWWIPGMVFSGSACIALLALEFAVPWHFGLLAVVMTFFLALIACRATGESDFTPSGPVGKVMQLTYGGLLPQAPVANLMTAGITTGAALAAADLLNDLKAGQLLGANPRRQFLAQTLGSLAGTVAVVVGFHLLVPDATAMLGDGDKAPLFAAPAAQSWKAVADVFSLGLGNMHPVHQMMMPLGAALGLVLLGLERALPKHRARIPSATGLGLGFVLPASIPVALCLGAVVAAVWQRRWPRSAENYAMVVASGVIAGGSIVGVVAALVNQLTGR